MWGNTVYGALNLGTERCQQLSWEDEGGLFQKSGCRAWGTRVLFATFYSGFFVDSEIAITTRRLIQGLNNTIHFTCFVPEIPGERRSKQITNFLQLSSPYWIVCSSGSFASGHLPLWIYIRDEFTESGAIWWIKFYTLDACVLITSTCCHLSNK